MDALTEITVLALAALASGILFTYLRQPAIVGYILVGVLLGPSAFGLIESREAVNLMAEMGVLMLLFIIGLELNLQDFQAAWKVATGFIFVQFGLIFLVIAGLSFFTNWSIGTITLITCAIGLSSTAVAIKMLEATGELKSFAGRLSVSILIAQDIAVVPLLVLIKNLGLSEFNLRGGVTLFTSIGLLVGVIWYLGRRDTLNVPFAQVVESNQEMMGFMALSVCFGGSLLAKLAGFSPAYGAFLGGLVLGNTKQHETLIQAIQPIQMPLLMVFFVSIGLLLDLQFIWQNFLTIIVLLLFITIGKAGINIITLHLFRIPWNVSFLGGIVLAQMGEFSFLLATLGEQIELISAHEFKLVISLTVLSLVISPLFMNSARRLERFAGEYNNSFGSIINTIYNQELKWCSRQGSWIFYLLCRALGRKKANRLTDYRLTQEDAGIKSPKTDSFGNSSIISADLETEIKTPGDTINPDENTQENNQQKSTIHEPRKHNEDIT